MTHKSNLGPVGWARGGRGEKSTGRCRLSLVTVRVETYSGDMERRSAREKHNARPGRESLSKRLGKVAKRIRARDGHACVYCGGTAASTGAHLHLDHLTPKSVGGADVATNLALACRRCNSARQDMTLAQFSAYASAVYGLTFTARQVRGQARRRLPELGRGAA